MAATGGLHHPMNRVAEARCAIVVALFVGDDENAKPQTPKELARAIAGDNDELYRMILTTVPLAPSEKQ